MTLLLLIVLVALSISFLCSVLEATLLSARVPELLERRERGDRGAAVLLELKQSRLDDAISSILILNTISHTIGAALAGARAAVVFGDRWVGVFSGVLTLLVLVATEIIPKTLGTSYASQLAGFVGRTVRLLTVGLAPILVVTRSLTRLVSHGGRRGISRAEVSALVALANREGAIRDQESRVVSNILRLEAVRVSDVMTPRTVVVMRPASTSLSAFVADEVAAPYSRVPVYEGGQDDVTGYVLGREALRAALEEGAERRTLAELARPLRSVRATERVGPVLRRLLESSEQMALVCDEFGGAAGIVTLEDLIETILGAEIVDESDPVADMRQLATQLRDERLKRARSSD
jgi:CBS domain containing-hemolysin-like protein